MVEAKTYSTYVNVQSSDLDENEHVNNVRYLNWVQDIAKAHWTKEAKAEWLDKYVWVALNHFIEYKKPAFLDDELLIETYIDSFDGVKSNRLVKIYRKGSKELLCQCRTVWVMLDKITNRPMRCPEAMVNAFFTPSGQ